MNLNFSFQFSKGSARLFSQDSKILHKIPDKWLFLNRLASE